MGSAEAGPSTKSQRDTVTLHQPPNKALSQNVVLKAADATGLFSHASGPFWASQTQSKRCSFTLLSPSTIGWLLQGCLEAPLSN